MAIGRNRSSRVPVRSGAVRLRTQRPGYSSRMASLDDAGVRDLLERPNYAVVSTLNRDGSVLDTVVWIGAEDGEGPG